MYTFLDMMASAQVLDKAQPHANVTIHRGAGSKIVMSYEWVVVVFEPDELVPYENMVMTVKVLLSEEVTNLTARVELDKCYNTQPNLVGTIASTSFRKVVGNRVNKTVLNKISHYIDVLFSGVDHLPDEAPHSTYFNKLVDSVNTLKNDTAMKNILSAGLSKGDGIVYGDVLYISLITSLRSAVVSVGISETSVDSDASLRVSINWIEGSGEPSPLTFFHIYNWQGLPSNKLIERITRSVLLEVDGKIPTSHYEEMHRVFKRLKDIYANQKKA